MADVRSFLRDAENLWKGWQRATLDVSTRQTRLSALFDKAERELSPGDLEQFSRGMRNLASEYNPGETATQRSGTRAPGIHRELQEAHKARIRREGR